MEGCAALPDPRDDSRAVKPPSPHRGGGDELPAELERAPVASVGAARRLTWGRVFVYAAIWTLVGVLYAVNVRIDHQYSGQSISWARALGLALTSWYLWALLFPLLLWLARRFPFERGRWFKSLLVHLPVTLLVANVKVVAESSLVRATLAPDHVPTVAMFNASILTCALLVGVGHALVYRASLRQRELRAFELESRLARARLQVLKSNLQPHFLFNTLHAVTTLMHRDVHAAEEMLTQLSDLLRLVLESTELPVVPLRAEIELNELFLKIQKTRFRERLDVEWEVDPQSLDAAVPSMILQPLVENAIEHGISKRARGGRIRITANRHAEQLVLTVEDDGPGLFRVHDSANDPTHPDQPEPGGAMRVRDDAAVRREGNGMGLANVRERLQQLYGSDQELRLDTVSRGGVRARVTLPFRSATPERGEAW